ncbi:hypothetical protein A7D17_20025 [Xanthomonas floridensis]|nr:hypothetical protein A7D17_20025 [Xanthomonas floridensis]
MARNTIAIAQTQIAPARSKADGAAMTTRYRRAASMASHPTTTTMRSAHRGKAREKRTLMSTGVPRPRTQLFFEDHFPKTI